MLKRERQAYILRQINLRNTVLSADLGEDINVSGDTLHRDLLTMGEASKPMDVRGDTLSTSIYNACVACWDRYSYPQKSSIAQKTASLIPERMFARTRVGTIVIEMIRAFAQNRQACLMTGKINCVRSISDNDFNAVQIQKAMVPSLLKQVCFTMAEKMNLQRLLQVCVRSKTNTLTTEFLPGNPYKRPIRKKRFRCYNLSS